MGQIKIKRILVPVDFSECSDAALEYGLTLAERFGAELELYHVWQTPHWVGPEMLVQVPGGDTEYLRDRIHDEARARIDALAERTDVPEGVQLKQTIAAGDPRMAILEHAAVNSDLIVVGTHGRHGLPRLLLGSVAEYVVRKASVPVLVVRAEPEES